MAERRAGVPEWLLERLAAGELSTERARELRARLEGAGELQRLDDIEASNQAILSAHPPADVVREIERRLSVALFPLSSLRPRRTWRIAAPGLAAAAAVAVAISLAHPGDPDSDISTPPAGIAGEPVRVKGLRPHLVVYKKTSSGALRLEAPAASAPGELIQVAYVSAQRRYGVIASVDAAGTVTLHLPENAGAAPRLVADGETALPHAFELDQAPGFERFVFVTGDRNFSTNEVVDALRNGAAFPADLSASEFLVTKELP